MKLSKLLLIYALLAVIPCQAKRKPTQSTKTPKSRSSTSTRSQKPNTAKWLVGSGALLIGGGLLFHHFGNNEDTYTPPQPIDLTTLKYISDTYDYASYTKDNLEETQVGFLIQMPVGSYRQTKDHFDDIVREQKEHASPNENNKLTHNLDTLQLAKMVLANNIICCYSSHDAIEKMSIKDDEFPTKENIENFNNNQKQQYEALKNRILISMHALNKELDHDIMKKFVAYLDEDKATRDYQQTMRSINITDEQEAKLSCQLEKAFVTIRNLESFFLGANAAKQKQDEAAKKEQEKLEKEAEERRQQELEEKNTKEREAAEKKQKEDLIKKCKEPYEYAKKVKQQFEVLNTSFQSIASNKALQNQFDGCKSLTRPAGEDKEVNLTFQHFRDHNIAGLKNSYNQVIESPSVKQFIESYPHCETMNYDDIKEASDIIKRDQNKGYLNPNGINNNLEARIEDDQLIIRTFQTYTKDKNDLSKEIQKIKDHAGNDFGNPLDQTFVGETETCYNDFGGTQTNTQWSDKGKLIQTYNLIQEARAIYNNLLTWENVWGTPAAIQHDIPIFSYDIQKQQFDGKLEAAKELYDKRIERTENMPNGF